MRRNNLAAELQRHLPWPVANAVASPWANERTKIKLALDVSSDRRFAPRGYLNVVHFATRPTWEGGPEAVAAEIRDTVNATLDLEASKKQKTPGALGTGGC